MLIEVYLPKTGMAMQDANIVAWLKEPGDDVSKGEPLVEIETEKVVEVIEAPASGVLEEVLYSEGDLAAVDDVIARIRAAEDVDMDKEKAVAEHVSGEAEQETKAIVATEESPDKEQGIGAGFALGSSVRMGQMRRTIARGMVSSLKTAAQLTLFTEVNVSRLVERREAYRAKGKDITYTDIIVYLTARAIERFPRVNGRLEDNEIVVPDTINLGVAVSLADGLVVPVIERANEKSLSGISQELRQLADAGRRRELESENLSGGTFTVSNLGMHLIDHFTPIINLPEVAILGVGRIIDKPVVVDREVIVGSMMGLSLTIDHRVIDGAPGAEFLTELGTALEAADF